MCEFLIYITSVSEFFYINTIEVVYDFYGKIVDVKKRIEANEVKGFRVCNKICDILITERDKTVKRPGICMRRTQVELRYELKCHLLTSFGLSIFIRNLCTFLIARNYSSFRATIICNWVHDLQLGETFRPILMEKRKQGNPIFLIV